MSAVAATSSRLDVAGGLANAELAFVVADARVQRPHALVAAFAHDIVATWSTGDTDVVGIGVAREIRASGNGRWTDVLDRLRGAATIATPHAPTELAFAKPRWFGGAAFAPSAAERAPWTGFGDAWFVMPRWTYVREGDRAAWILAVTASEASDPRWHRELARLRECLDAPFAPAAQPAVVELGHASAETWRDQVTSITDAIASGACSKIVAARTCNVALAGQIRVADLLAALDERHADCVRVAIHPPGAGTLVAATPERLVRRTGAIVECDALAGTRSANEAGAGDALLASHKDRREHQLVVDAIATALADAKAIEAPSTPLVKKLRHVLHLHTPFRAEFTGSAAPHVVELAARLHPTPAVGGTPRALAVEWIRDREPVARGWYASPVGWFDLEGNGEFVVAIRSGVVAGNRAWLWAGAGIVAGSDPDRELAETESKLRAMLGALGALGAST